MDSFFLVVERILKPLLPDDLLGLVFLLRGPVYYEWLEPGLFSFYFGGEEEETIALQCSQEDHDFTRIRSLSNPNEIVKSFEEVEQDYRAWDPELDRMVIADQDRRTYHIFDLRERKITHTFLAYPDSEVEWTSAGLLYFSEERVLCLWNPDTGEKQEFQEPGITADSGNFTIFGDEIFFAPWDRALYSRSLKTREILRRLPFYHLLGPPEFEKGCLAFFTSDNFEDLSGSHFNIYDNECHLWTLTLPGWTTSSHYLKTDDIWLLGNSNKIFTWDYRANVITVLFRVGEGEEIFDLDHSGSYLICGVKNTEGERVLVLDLVALLDFLKFVE